MSTWSKVKRQVRRNMRETPKVRRRREAARRAQMAASAGRWVVYHPGVSFVFSPGTVNVGGVWMPAPIVLSADTEGGSAAEFDRILREARDSIAVAIVGKSVGTGTVPYTVSLDTGRNFGPAVPL